MFVGRFFGGECVVKERFSKKYRNPDLDARLTKRRLLQEARNMARVAAAGRVRTPHLLLVERGSSSLFMERVQRAVTLKVFINALQLK